MLTRRGWSLLGISAGLFLAGRVLGLVQLAVLSAAGFLLVAGAAAWISLHPLRLRPVRTVPARLQAAVDSRADLAVTNGSSRVTATVAVVESFDGARRTARFSLPPLPPGETARAAYRVPTERRGRFALGPLRATVSDPFGIVRRTAQLLAADEVIVYPRVHDLLPPPETAGDDLERDAPRLSGRPEPGSEFMALREYAPGDDLRRVHWRTTARRDVLMVRQDEARRRAPVLVMLDVRPAAHDRNSFERAIEIVASVATALDRAGRPFDVVTTTGRRLGAPGRRHLASVLDELAVIEPGGPDRVVTALAGRRASALVAVMGRCRETDLASTALHVRSGGLLLFAATGPSAPLVASRGRRLRVLPVDAGPGRSLPSAWNDAVLTWHQTVHDALPLPASRS